MFSSLTVFSVLDTESQPFLKERSLNCFPVATSSVRSKPSRSYTTVENTSTSAPGFALWPSSKNSDIPSSRLFIMTSRESLRFLLQSFNKSSSKESSTLGFLSTSLALRKAVSSFVWLSQQAVWTLVRTFLSKFVSGRANFPDCLLSKSWFVFTLNFDPAMKDAISFSQRLTGTLWRSENASANLSSTVAMLSLFSGWPSYSAGSWQFLLIWKSTSLLHACFMEWSDILICSPGCWTWPSLDTLFGPKETSISSMATFALCSASEETDTRFPLAVWNPTNSDM